jgi:hypothetical protein
MIRDSRPNTLLLEGRPVVLAENDASLIAVGDEFLDDAIRHAFREYRQADCPREAATVVPNIRIVVETLSVRE